MSTFKLWWNLLISVYRFIKLCGIVLCSLELLLIFHYIFLLVYVKRYTNLVDLEIKYQR